MIQIELFEPTVIEQAFLVADSPKKAFYFLRLTICATGGASIFKASGRGGKICDRRQWPFETLEAAEKVYKRKLAAKLNPKRKNPRKYVMAAAGGKGPKGGPLSNGGNNITPTP